MNPTSTNPATASFPTLLDPGTLTNLYNFIPYLSLAILFVFCFYILERYQIENNKTPFPKEYVYLLFALGLAIRIFLNYNSYCFSNCASSNYLDVESAKIYAELTFSGENVYRYKLQNWVYTLGYPPFWILWLVLFKYISILTDIPFVFLYKYLGIVTDIIFVFFVLYFISKDLKGRQNMSLLLALSPVVISVSVVFGQFDLIPTFFAFLAFLLLVNDEKRWKWAALSLGFGVFAKTFPIILLPAFLFQFSSIKRKIMFSCIVMAPITLSLMIAPIIHTTPQDIVINVISQRGVVGGSHGISGLLWVLGQVFIFFSNNSNGYKILETFWILYNNYGIWMIIVSLGTGYLFLFKKASLLERIIYTYLVFYVFSTAVQVNYLVWILPFLYYGVYTFASGFHFWSNLAIFIHIPFTVGGIFHLEQVDKLFPLMMGLFWIYSLYCLILITRNIWIKSNDPH